MSENIQEENEAQVQEKNESKNKSGFGCLIIFIILCIIGFCSNSNSTDGTGENPITSTEYINSKIQPMAEEYREIASRENVGLNVDKNYQELLEFKCGQLAELKGPNAYHYYWRMDVNHDAIKEQCFNKYGVTDEAEECINSNSGIKTSTMLEVEYERLKKTFKRGDISEEEFKTLKDKIISNDKKIIKEADTIINLTEIPKHLRRK